MIPFCGPIIPHSGCRTSQACFGLLMQASVSPRWQCLGTGIFFSRCALLPSCLAVQNGKEVLNDFRRWEWSDEWIPECSGWDYPPLNFHLLEHMARVHTQLSFATTYKALWAWELMNWFETHPKCPSNTWTRETLVHGVLSGRKKKWNDRKDWRVTSVATSTNSGELWALRDLEVSHVPPKAGNSALKTLQ